MPIGTFRTNTGSDLLVFLSFSKRQRLASNGEYTHFWKKDHALSRNGRPLANSNIGWKGWDSTPVQWEPELSQRWSEFWDDTKSDWKEGMKARGKTARKNFLFKYWETHYMHQNRSSIQPFEAGPVNGQREVRGAQSYRRFAGEQFSTEQPVLSSGLSAGQQFSTQQPVFNSWPFSGQQFSTQQPMLGSDPFADQEPLGTPKYPLSSGPFAAKEPLGTPKRPLSDGQSAGTNLSLAEA